jgi:RNA recognition motif-containing protein
LSYDTRQNELESLFSEVGTVVDVFLPDDRSTGRPRGFAFVEFTEESAAAEAIKRFDGYQLNGRSIGVREAEERQRRFSDSSDSGPTPVHRDRGGKGSKPKGSRRNVRRNIRSRKGGF